MYDVKHLRSLLGSNGTEKYEVPTHLPNISFEIPPSWAGYAPVSNKPNETRQDYFWLFPATGKVGHDNLVVWLNGGPGCSALSGAFTEEGPVKFDHKTHIPFRNPYSWTNLTNMIWVDHPPGTGFSRGATKNQSMPELAEDFFGFLENLYKEFPKLKGKKLWIMGESWAGKPIPWMADHIYKHEKEAKKAGINLQGIGMNNGFIMENTMAKHLPLLQFAKLNQKVMKISDQNLSEVMDAGKKVGLDGYVEKNLHYPPKGKLSVPEQFNETESPYKMLQTMARDVNPCISPYYIAMPSPCPPDPLGMQSNREKSHKDNYFNNIPAVKKALNADENITWIECSSVKPLDIMKKSKTEYPVDEVLPRVIEKSKRVLLEHGTWDYLVLTNGTAMALQNMTWSGKQGFQSPPNRALMVDGKKVGNVHTERNLTLANIFHSGHMVSIYTPKATYKLLEYLLGQIEESELSKK